MNNKQKQDKLFIVRKYVWASDAENAISKEKKQKADDVWIDEEWKKNQPTLKDGIGFYRNAKNKS